jgi:hypothetical protein
LSSWAVVELSLVVVAAKLSLLVAAVELTLVVAAAKLTLVYAIVVAMTQIAAMVVATTQVAAVVVVATEVAAMVVAAIEVAAMVVRSPNWKIQSLPHQTQCPTCAIGHDSQCSFRVSIHHSLKGIPVCFYGGQVLPYPHVL